MISTTDDRIGKVLATLDSLGMRDNTIIVFASDNGHSAETSHIRADKHSSGLPKGHNYGANGGGGNTGKWRGTKGTFFEGGIRVPAILSFKGQVPAGVTRGQAVSVADFYPTILDLCGLKPPPVELDGKSLIDILKSPNAPSPHSVMHWQWRGTWAVRRGDWKLVSLGKKVVLANLAEPRPEQTNHAAARPALVAELTALHKRWAEEVMPAPNKAPLRGILRKAGVDPRHLEPWPALSTAEQSAWRSGDAVILTFHEEVPTQVRIPRLATAVKSIDWRGDRRAVGSVDPGIKDWLLRTKALPRGLKPVIIVRTNSAPAVHRDLVPIAPGPAGVVTLAASKAQTIGSRLRFEPQPEKDTLGYWVDQGDHARWRIDLPGSRDYHVEVLQGCGTGQGGSQVLIKIGDQGVPFSVEDTGHFHKFRRRRIGKVSLDPGSHLVEVRIQKIAKDAVMDLREIRLIPVPAK